MGYIDLEKVKNGVTYIYSGEIFDNRSLHTGEIIELCLMNNSIVTKSNFYSNLRTVNSSMLLSNEWNEL